MSAVNTKAVDRVYRWTSRGCLIVGLLLVLQAKHDWLAPVGAVLILLGAGISMVRELAAAE